MRFDRPTISLEPRTTSNCLDLAFMFMRTYFVTIFALWSTVAIPACVATFILVDRYEYNLLAAIVVYTFASSGLGVVIMIGAAPCAFGEPFTFRTTMRRLASGSFTLLLWGLLQRLAILAGFCFLLIPGWYLIARTGFFVEQSVLKNIARHLHDRRADELLKGEMGELMFRLGWMAIYSALLWLGLLFTFDALASHMFGWPIFLGRLKVDATYLEDVPELMQYALSFMWSDSIVVTSMLAVALLIYPLVRLAWFFCYVDVRVRRDCWDMELQILQEARRLEGTA